ncbi:MAG: hypothetical protein JXR63_07570 [Spirochaetales bacterium]|nr:hypothetical protein [Spirochaetales bacterium]
MLKNKINSKYSAYANNFIINNAVSIINILSLPLIIKAIGNEANGKILYIQAIAFLINDLLTMQTSLGVVRFFDHQKKETHAYLYFSFFIDLFSGILSFLCLNILLYFSFLDIEKELILFFRLFSFVLILRPLVTGSASGIIRKNMMFSKISKIILVKSLLKFCLIVLGFFKDLGFVYFLFIEGLSEFLLSLIYLLFFVWYVVRNRIKIRKIERSDLGFFLFNIKNGAVITLDAVLGNLSAIFIKKYLGFSDLSLIKVVEKIGNALGKFIVPSNQILYTKLCSNKDSDIYFKIIKKYLRHYFFVSFFVFVLISLSIRMWLPVLYVDPQSYHYYVAIFYIFTIFLGTVLSIFQQTVLALDRIHVVLKFLVIINLLYLLSLPFFIRAYAIWGFLFLKLIQLLLIASVKVTLSVRRVEFEH